LFLAERPDGEFDARSIWNVRARFLYRGGVEWRDAFAPSLVHADYPLLLPLSVNRLWHYAGTETPLAHQLVGWLFPLATLGLLVGTLAVLRGPGQACLGGLTLLAMPLFVEIGALQYADVPLGFAMLATVSCLVLAARERAPGTRLRLLALAGLAAGCAAWTKNEGMAFALGAALAIAVLPLWGWTGPSAEPRERFRDVLAFAAGLAPCFLCLLVLKLKLAPANDLFQDQQATDQLKRLFAPWRQSSLAITSRISSAPSTSTSMCPIPSNGCSSRSGRACCCWSSW
jgi:hypothetical protein